MTPRLDRLIPLLTLMLAGFGIIFLLDAGPMQAVFNFGSVMPRIPVAWPLVLMLSLLAGAGTEFILRAHRGFKQRMLTAVRWGPFDADLLLPLWILPALTPAIVFAFFRLFRGQFGIGAYMGVLLTSGLILILVYVTQHYLLLGAPDQQAMARTTQSIIAYGLAFGSFAAITFSQQRTLYAACGLVPTVLLLSYHLLHDQLQHPWILAWLIAMVLVGSYWVMDFWPARFLLHAAALLLIFYAAIGILQQATESGIPRRVLIEYGLITLGGLLLLGIAAFVLGDPSAHGLAPTAGLDSGRLISLQ